MLPCLAGSGISRHCKQAELSKARPILTSSTRHRRGGSNRAWRMCSHRPEYVLQSTRSSYVMRSSHAYCSVVFCFGLAVCPISKIDCSNPVCFARRIGLRQPRPHREPLPQVRYRVAGPWLSGVTGGGEDQRIARHDADRARSRLRMATACFMCFKCL